MGRERAIEGKPRVFGPSARWTMEGIVCVKRDDVEGRGRGRAKRMVPFRLTFEMRRP